MFLDKERHWITGPFYNKIYYDSWKQWTGLHIYTDWKYRPMLWNIQDLDDKKNQLQIIYSMPDGDLKCVCIIIDVRFEDESTIREWLNEQQWLSK